MQDALLVAPLHAVPVARAVCRLAGGGGESGNGGAGGGPGVLEPGLLFVVYHAVGRGAGDKVVVVGNYGVPPCVLKL